MREVKSLKFCYIYAALISAIVNEYYQNFGKQDHSTCQDHDRSQRSRFELIATKILGLDSPKHLRKKYHHRITKKDIIPSNTMTDYAALMGLIQ
jgi:hypothetical protein